MTTKQKTDAQQPEQASEGQHLPAVKEGNGEIAFLEHDGPALAMQLIEELPEVEDDPTPTMIMAIMAAPSWQQLNKMFEADHFKDHNLRQCRIHDIRRNWSDYEGGFGQYLLLDVTWLDSGERTVCTCGAIMAMCQILYLWKNELLPADCEIIRREKPTKRGFHPMHVRILQVRQAPAQSA